MDGIKKKLQNLKIQVDEAEERASEAEKSKKELEEERDSVSCTYYSYCFCTAINLLLNFSPLKKISFKMM